MTISSIGYQGHDTDSFIAELTQNKVDLVVDVRLNPFSRKPGFSKKALTAALSEHDIRYLHIAALGNPRDNRDGYRTGDPQALQTFEDVLDGAAAQQAMSYVTRIAQHKHVMLMCYEADVNECHRRPILSRVQAMLTEPAD